MSNVDEKTRLDSNELEIEVQEAAEEKVALDLEGADFLEDETEHTKEEDTAPAIKDSSLEEVKDDEQAEKPKSKLKLIIILVVVLLAVGGAAFWWFGLREPPPPPVEPEIIRVPKAPTAPPAPDDHIVSFEPYWVPLPDGKGGTVFLVAKFAIVTKNEQLRLEAQNKMVLLRDAVYYYLINKPYHFLIDYTNVPTIKKDLTSIFKGYLVNGEIDDMLFEGYIGK